MTPSGSNALETFVPQFVLNFCIYLRQMYRFQMCPSMKIPLSWNIPPVDRHMLLCISFGQFTKVGPVNQQPPVLRQCDCLQLSVGPCSTREYVPSFLWGEACTSVSLCKNTAVLPWSRKPYVALLTFLDLTCTGTMGSLQSSSPVSPLDTKVLSIATSDFLSSFLWRNVKYTWMLETTSCTGDPFSAIFAEVSKTQTAKTDTFFPQEASFSFWVLFSNWGHKSNACHSPQQRHVLL